MLREFKKPTLEKVEFVVAAHLCGSGSDTPINGLNYHSSNPLTTCTVKTNSKTTGYAAYCTSTNASNNAGGMGNCDSL